MSHSFATMTSTEKWRLLVEAAKSAVETKEYELERVPGRGRANMWKATTNDNNIKIAIRTTQDRAIAFHSQNEGTAWKTLDQADLVAIAAVADWSDSPDINVYLFEAEHVKKHFNEARTARKAAGQTVNDETPMWVGLDIDDRTGSGIAAGHEPIATYGMKGLIAKGIASSPEFEPEPDDLVHDSNEPTTIAEVLDRARQLIASISGIPVDSVKLDCKIGI